MNPCQITSDCRHLLRLPHLFPNDARPSCGEGDSIMSIERQLIENLLEGSVKAHELCGSTSQLITAFLAVGRFEELPQPYENKEDAWSRLDTRQRNVVRQFNPTFNAARWAGPSSYDPLFVHNETE